MGVVAIDIYDGDDVLDFVKFWRSNGGGDVTWALAPELVRPFQVRVLGQTVVIDSAGGVVYNGPPVSYSTLRDYVEAAL